MRNFQKLLSWIAGILGLIAVAAYFGVDNIPDMLRSVGICGTASWIALTLLARLIQAETSYAPIKALGYSMSRSVAFWIGWLRTFANQIFPAAGVAAYAQALRRRVDISWSELTALAAPQFVLLAAALGIVGLVATLTNSASLGQITYALLLIYGSTIAGGLTIIYAAPSFAKLLPLRFAIDFGAASEALEQFLKKPSLIALVIGCHVAVILLRTVRIWLLFAAGGSTLEWNEILLIVAVSESSTLIQFTPGGLGLREGAMLAGASLLGVSTEVAAGVALLDRLFIVSITVFLTPSAIFILESRGPTIK